MSNKKFTIEEQKHLSSNPYAKNVTENSITYTDEFREYFINQYNIGIMPSKIFLEAGFNPKVLGIERIKSAAYRFKKMDKRLDGLKDTRKTNSGRTLKKELSDKDKIQELKQENMRLRQQLEFLKKMEFLVKQVKSNKLKQTKDTNTSKRH